MTLSLVDINQKLEEFEVKFGEVEQTNKLLSRQIKELYLLYDAVKKLNLTKHLKDVHATLTAILRVNFNIEEFAVFLYNPKSQILTAQLSNGLPKGDIKEFFYKTNEGFVGKTFNSGSPHYIRDIGVYKNFKYYQMEKKTPGCIYYIPLKISPSEILGVLKLRKPVPDSFSDMELDILNKLSEPLGTAIRKGIAFDTIERTAWIDDLTGLYAKKYLDSRYESEIRRAQRYQHPLSVIALAIENLKEIAKKFGKLSENLVMREFASFLERNMRACDICFRYSGNQFVVLLPETAKSAANGVLTKIDRYWADKEIMLYDDVPLSIRILHGSANYPIDTIEPPVLLKLALESLKES
jgi:diguanylate cyclase (GGDEF)-like protein